jgi:hypothetical protein
MATRAVVIHAVVTHAVVIHAAAIRVAAIQTAVRNVMRCALPTAIAPVLLTMIMVSVTGPRKFVKRVVRRSVIELGTLNGRRRAYGGSNMEVPRMGKHALIAVVITVLLSAAAVGLVIRRSGGVMQAQQRPDIRSETLRTQAQKTGSATATARPTNLRRYDTVDALAHDSSAIIVGRVDTKTSLLLPPAEKFVVTDFQITVQDTMKGVLARGQAIRVRTPGGRVDLGDGKSAEVTMPDFWKYPEVGKLYVLFLESRNDGSFVLRGGPQGLFEVTREQTVKAQVRPEDKLMQNYNDKSLASFLNEIRQSNK